jgi:flagellar biosynthesis GTPase FlhF
MCPSCNAKTVLLHRMFAKWPISQWDDLPQTLKDDFWRSTGKTSNDILDALANVIINSKKILRQSDNRKGQYLPLAVYEKQGYDTANFEKTCPHYYSEKFNCEVYKADIHETTSEEITEGVREELIQMRSDAAARKRQRSRSSSSKSSSADDTKNMTKAQKLAAQKKKAQRQAAKAKAQEKEARKEAARAQRRATMDHQKAQAEEKRAEKRAAKLDEAAHRDEARMHALLHMFTLAPRGRQLNRFHCGNSHQMSGSKTARKHGLRCHTSSFHVLATDQSRRERKEDSA